jgi:hypothetical protein
MATNDAIVLQDDLNLQHQDDRSRSRLSGSGSLEEWHARRTMALAAAPR